MKQVLQIITLSIAFLLGMSANAQNCCSKKSTAACRKNGQAVAQAPAANATASQQLANCPLAGTPDCPLIKNCPKKGLADCPYAQQAGKQPAQKTEEEVPACCKKRKGNP